MSDCFLLTLRLQEGGFLYMLRPTLDYRMSIRFTEVILLVFGTSPMFIKSVLDLYGQVTPFQAT